MTTPEQSEQISEDLQSNIIGDSDLDLYGMKDLKILVKREETESNYS
jgi:hypothetical protein